MLKWIAIALVCSVAFAIIAVAITIRMFGS
jgi:hypothetical protein